MPSWQDKRERAKALVEEVKAEQAHVRDAQHAQQLDAKLREARTIGAEARAERAEEERGQLARIMEAGRNAPVGGYAMLSSNAPPAGVEEWQAATGERMRVLPPSARLGGYQTAGLSANSDSDFAEKVSRPASGEGLSLGKYVRGVITGNWKGAERERAAMSEGVLGGGGYMVPTPLSSEVIDRARNAAVVIQAGARTIPMESQTLRIARVTGDPLVGWRPENAAIPAGDMSFDSVTLTARTLAGICKLSVELAEDAPNVDSLVGETLGRVLALELDRAALRGDGTASAPLGIRNQAGVAVDSTTMGANGAAPTNYDFLAGALSSVQVLNEAPNAIVYSARTAGKLDRLKNTLGDPLKAPDSVTGMQRLVTNAIPVNLTQGTSSDASEAYVGDFSKLLIGVRTELALEISREAADGSGSAFGNLQVWVRCYMRADVAVMRPTAFGVVTGVR